MRGGPRRRVGPGLPIRSVALACLLVPIGGAPALATDGANAAKSGAYCPLPEPGQPAECLEPAQQRYESFFGALEKGSFDPAAAARIERDLAAGSDAPYDALSSLAYGYYRLARRAAADPNADPAVILRLERWNDMLARAYEKSGSDPAFRAAVRAAAADVNRRAPAVGLRCLDEWGDVTTCSSTEAVIRGMDALRDQTGLRGQLARLFARLFGTAP
jgi:hypothetical protein